LARTTEVIGVTWAEIDMQAAIWTVPDERMKAGKERRVPLSEPVLAVLREIAALRQSDAPDAPDAPDAALLPSGKGGKSSKALSIVAMLMLLRRMGRGALTVHGFRSSFRDWAADISARWSKPRLPTRSSRRWKRHIAAGPIREAVQADERLGQRYAGASHRWPAMSWLCGPRREMDSVSLPSHSLLTEAERPNTNNVIAGACDLRIIGRDQPIAAFTSAPLNPALTRAY
jgi:hypothetical protein